MICVRLDGGMGNQLFQYAAGRALAERHGVELVLDDSALHGRSRRVTPRRLELHHFRHAARVARVGEARWLPLARRLPWIARVTGTWRPYRERGLMFNPAFEALPDRSYLVGYWQSPRYFGAIAATLGEELRPAQPLSSQSADIAERTEHCESVALHVRRGDYVTLQSAAALHGTLPLTYYASAISQLRSTFDSPHFFVFSDDPAWCASHLPLHSGEATQVSHNVGSMAWQDLVLMSRCRHHVIANSSFSWWGAWLADRQATPQRQVFAPSRWFGGQSHDTRDRFPAHWKAIP